jgi:hypothetical protein
MLHPQRQLFQLYALAKLGVRGATKSFESQQSWKSYSTIKQGSKSRSMLLVFGSSVLLGITAGFAYKFQTDPQFKEKWAKKSNKLFLDGSKTQGTVDGNNQAHISPQQPHVVTEPSSNQHEGTNEEVTTDTLHIEAHTEQEPSASHHVEHIDDQYTSTSGTHKPLQIQEIANQNQHLQVMGVEAVGEGYVTEGLKLEHAQTQNQQPMEEEKLSSSPLPSLEGEKQEVLAALTTVTGEVLKDLGVTTAIQTHESQLAHLKETVDGLLAELQRATARHKETQEHQALAFREVIAAQEKAYQHRLEEELAKVHEEAEQRLLAERRAIDQRYRMALQQELEKEKAVLVDIQKQLIARKHEELHHEYQRQIAESLTAYEKELVKQLEEIDQQYRKRHNDRISVLKGLRNDLQSFESVIRSNIAQQSHVHAIHELSVVLFDLGSALAAPRRTPFVQALQALRQAGRGDEVVEATCTKLEGMAKHGVSSYNQLVERFKLVVQMGRRAALVPEHGGVFANIVAAVASRLIIPEKGLVEGNDPEALFAKAEYYLEQGDLQLAVSHLERLQGTPATIAIDWMRAARERLAAEQCLSVLQSHVASMVINESVSLSA